MNPTKEKESNWRFWVTLLIPSIVLAASFIYLLFVSPERGESNRRFVELSGHYRDEVLMMKRAHIDNLKEIKDRLIVLETAMEKIRPKEETAPIDPDPPVPSQADEFVGKLESMSDEEYQSMVLKQVKASDRKLVEQHFKQENAFKTSLKPSEKQRFDADVKRECAKLLSNSKVESELSDLQKEVFRRSAESMVITDWRVKDSVAQQDERWASYIDRKREENRLWNEEFWAKMVEKFGPEFLE